MRHIAVPGLPHEAWRQRQVGSSKRLQDILNGPDEHNRPYDSENQPAADDATRTTPPWKQKRALPVVCACGYEVEVRPNLQHLASQVLGFNWPGQPQRRRACRCTARFKEQGKGRPEDNDQSARRIKGEAERLAKRRSSRPECVIYLWSVVRCLEPDDGHATQPSPLTACMQKQQTRPVESRRVCF